MHAEICVQHAPVGSGVGAACVLHALVGSGVGAACVLHALVGSGVGAACVQHALVGSGEGAAMCATRPGTTYYFYSQLPLLLLFTTTPVLHWITRDCSGLLQ